MNECIIQILNFFLVKEIPVPLSQSPLDPLPSCHGPREHVKNWMYLYLRMHVYLRPSVYLNVTCWVGYV